MRVSLDEDIPILQGTTATISASFTGVSTVSLGGAVQGRSADHRARARRRAGDPGRARRPRRDPRQRAAAARAAGDADRPADAAAVGREPGLDQRHPRQHRPDERAASPTWAPSSARALVELQGHAGAVDRDARRVREARCARPIRCSPTKARAWRASCARRCKSAQQAAAALEATLQRHPPGGARAGRRPRCRSPTPRCRTCKRTSAALRAVTERIETEGAGSLIGGTKLPDYEP